MALFHRGQCSGSHLPAMLCWASLSDLVNLGHSTFRDQSFRWWLCRKDLAWVFQRTLQTLGGLQAIRHYYVKSWVMSHQRDFVQLWLSGLLMFHCPRCTSEAQCPGGTPNTCGADRIGTPCGECPSSTFWNKSKCAECSTWALVGWIIGVVLIFLCLIFVSERKK